MAATPFRFRCPSGRHVGVVPGKLFCTACGRMHGETDEEYVRHLDAKLLSLGGTPMTKEENTIAFKEAYVRVLVNVANDTIRELDPSLN